MAAAAFEPLEAARQPGRDKIADRLINIDENVIYRCSERPPAIASVAVRASIRFNELLFHRWPSVYPHPRLPTRNVEEPDLFPVSRRGGNIPVETMSEPDSSLIAEFNAHRSEDAFAALVRQQSMHLIAWLAVPDYRRNKRRGCRGGMRVFGVFRRGELYESLTFLRAFLIGGSWNSPLRLHRKLSLPCRENNSFNRLASSRRCPMRRMMRCISNKPRFS